MSTPSALRPPDPTFGEHALAIARRQYFLPEEETIQQVFRRVAAWVASAEPPDSRAEAAERFFDLMVQQRFCPGGRILAGAATAHGNMLNCFVQDGSPEQEGSDAWVLHLALKLALVTKVGGGNGLNLDPIPPKRAFDGPCGRLFLTGDEDHPDLERIRSGTFLDLSKGEVIGRGYRRAVFLDTAAASHTATVFETASPVKRTAEVPADPDGTTPSILHRRVADSVEDIWLAAADMVQAMLRGQDVVIDLSDLRPEGAEVRGSGGSSSGPASFAVEVFDSFAVWASLGGAAHAGPVATLRYVFGPTLRAIRQGGTRRGAGMATLSAEHPDLPDFITAKELERERDEGDISTFNISVLAGDDFMRGARGGADPLREIASLAWATGEPGLIFIDRINQHNPMRAALGDIRSTNPCGEAILYPGEPCDLGAINLATYVATPGLGLAGFDFRAFRQDTASCVRFLDDVLDVNVFALADNREMSMKLRRLGLGLMGLADALIRMGYAYDSEAGRAAVDEIVTAMREAALEASEALAGERGAFPLFADSDLSSPRRNVAILTVAPTGTTSMLMGVSSGVEPVFAPFVHRRIGSEFHALVHPLFKELLESHRPAPGLDAGGHWDWQKVVAMVQANHGSVQGLAFVPEQVRAVFRCAHDIDAEDHVRMQATVQRAFDAGERLANAISKTINLRGDATVDDVERAYMLAFESGCKGITVYRDGSRQFQVLSTAAADGQTTANEIHAAPTASSRAGGPGKATPRPLRLSGFTDQVKLTLPNGDKRGFFVTVNQQGGLPAEVFIVSGKAGDEANADSEALGRVVSIALQHGVPAEALVKTLRGINGGMFGSYHGRMVASKADLLAVALETAGAENVLENGKACPDCGGPLRYEEGCHSCGSCGYSKCG